MAQWQHAWLGWTLVLGAIAPGAFAGGAAPVLDPITLTVGAATGNPGAIVEVTVSLASGEDSPATLILFIEFDPDVLALDEDAYEIVLTDSFGNPILDDLGNTLFRRAPVRPSAILPEDKGIDYDLMADAGLAGVFIGGINNTLLPDGELVTAAFRILAGAPENTTAPLDGIDSNSAVIIGEQSFSSSAAVTVRVSDGAGGMVDVEAGFDVLITDGAVEVGCTAAEAPTGLTATTGAADGVTLEWDAVATAGAEYRVFRSETNNSATAVPLGDQWQTETDFLDITALLPRVVGRDACNPEVSTPVSYFYWVKARSATGCESAFSATPATGSRGAAKALLGSAGAPGTLLIFAALLALFSRVAWRMGAVPS
ncbi:MAG: hypothetical protein HYV27_11120 [Candidatus Hydrogenedentes bacterium]|nr:hypothetical protein [Candidatus Hydrogenedentota bacterium]